MPPYARRVLTELDLDLGDGRMLHIYDAGATGAGDDLAVFWHHGTPGLGEPPEPLVPAAALGIRWVSFDRPGYGGSTRLPDRDVAAMSADTASVADALGIDTFAVFGASGGCPHALACAASMPDRVLGVVCIAGLAPFAADGLDWFAGMAAAAEAELRAACVGPDELSEHLTTAAYDPEIFTPADHMALAGIWSWLGDVAGKGMEGGIDGMLDDDLAYVRPWGFAPEQVGVPALFVHGEKDRIVPAAHSNLLARRVPDAELRLRTHAGHISVLSEGVAAMKWLTGLADR
jgi:pimeloyl-ACP methyl ester carboxylesterase